MINLLLTATALIAIAIVKILLLWIRFVIWILNFENPNSNHQEYQNQGGPEHHDEGEIEGIQDEIEEEPPAANVFDVEDDFGLPHNFPMHDPPPPPNLPLVVHEDNADVQPINAIPAPFSDLDGDEPENEPDPDPDPVDLPGGVNEQGEEEPPIEVPGNFEFDDAIPHNFPMYNPPPPPDLPLVVYDENTLLFVQPINAIPIPAPFIDPDPDQVIESDSENDEPHLNPDPLNPDPVDPVPLVPEPAIPEVPEIVHDQTDEAYQPHGQLVEDPLPGVKYYKLRSRLVVVNPIIVDDD